MKRSLFAVSLLTALGCVVSTGVVRLDTPHDYPEVAPEDVVVYRTADQIPGPHERLALLNSTRVGGWTTEAAMIESMQKEAGKLGANAIILSDPGAVGRIADALSGDRTGRAVAIRVVSGALVWPWPRNQPCRTLLRCRRLAQGGELPRFPVRCRRGRYHRDARGNDQPEQRSAVSGTVRSEVGDIQGCD